MAVAGNGWRGASDRCQERRAIPEDPSGEGRILAASAPGKAWDSAGRGPPWVVLRRAFLFMELLDCRAFPFETLGEGEAFCQLEPS